MLFMGIFMGMLVICGYEKLDNFEITFKVELDKFK